MHLLHDDSFISLLKAAILSKVWNRKAIHESLSSKGLSVNDYSLKRCQLEWEWLCEPPMDVSKLRKAVDLFTLHKVKDYDLLFKVLRQALIHGPDYVLLRKSREARRFCNMVRSVRSEFHKACVFGRFKEDKNKLFCNFFFSHKIQNLLVEHFSKRFPGKEVIVNNYKPVRESIPVGIKLHSFLK
jgi:hypothetical protein